MVTTPHYPRRRIGRLVFAAAAAVAALTLFDAAQAPADPTHVAAVPQTPPDLSGGSGFAADDGDDEAQLQQQLQQSMQQAEQQNEQAQQQFEQSMQQAQLDEQQANNP